MGFKTSKAPAFQRDLAPAGNHRAAIVAVIDLGAHMESYQGGPEKRTEKVFVVYELLDEEHHPPYVLGRMYTASTHEKAAFAKVCAAAFARPLKVGEDVDLETLVAKCVMVEVEHRSTGDATYDGVGNVTAVAAMLRKLPTKSQIVPFYSDPEDYRDRDWVPFIYGKSVAGKIAERVREAAPAGSQAAPVGDGETF